MLGPGEPLFDVGPTTSDPRARQAFEGPADRRSFLFELQPNGTTAREAEVAALRALLADKGVSAEEVEAAAAAQRQPSIS